MWILTALISILGCVLWYLHHRLTYWQRKGVQTPGLPYQWRYYKRQLPLYDMENRARYGSVYGIMEALTPILIVSDPDAVRDVFVKDFASFPNHKPFRIGVPIIDLNLFSQDGGDDWKRIRSLLSPTFTSGKLRAMVGEVNSCVEVFKRNLGKAADGGEAIDAKKYFNTLAFDVLTRCAYGTRIESMNDPHSPIQKNFETAFQPNWATFVALFFPRLAKWTGLVDVATGPLKFFVEMTTSLLEERSAGGGHVYNDFLQTMIDANREALKEDSQSKKTITKDEMMSQAMTFLLAGFDTTATILAACSYHLAENPSMQERLVEEVSTLHEYTHDTVQDLKYLEAFLKEAFRVSPPFIRVERQCVAPTMVKGIKVEPGNIVSVPAFVVHRDPEQYPDPERFDPDRFLEGGVSAAHHPYAYLPFGAGPRNCIAQRFALMNIKLALAQIMKEYTFEATEGTQMSYIPMSIDTLNPNPIFVKVRKN